MSCNKEEEKNLMESYELAANEAQLNFLKKNLDNRVIVFGTAGETVGEAFKKMWEDKALPYNFIPVPNVWGIKDESKVGFFKEDTEKYRGISSGLNTLWHLEDREIMKDLIDSQNQESGPMPDITRILPGPDGIGKVVVYGTIDKGHKRKKRETLIK